MSSRTPAPRFSFLFAAALVAAIPFAPITSYAATYTVTAFTDAASGGAAGNNTDASGGGAAAGPDIFVRLGTLTTTSSTSTGTCATGGSGGSASSGASFAGASGSAEGSPVFNFGGTVNSSTTVGAFTSALSTSSSTR